MSIVVTTGEIAAAAGDAYGAYQGGLSSPANQASFGAAVAAATSTLASNARGAPFLNGLGIGAAPAASAAQLGLNVGNLMNPQATAAEKLAASLGILGSASALPLPARYSSAQGADLRRGDFQSGSTDRRAFCANHQPAQRQGHDDLHHAPDTQGLASG